MPRHLLILLLPLAVLAADEPRRSIPREGDQPGVDNRRRPEPRGDFRNDDRRPEQPRPPLTPEEQRRLQAAMQKANEDPDVKEAREDLKELREKMEKAMRAEREAVERAAIAADPEVKPLLEKMRKFQEEMRRRMQPDNRRPDGDRPGEPRERDGDRPKVGPRDGDQPRVGPRDGEGDNRRPQPPRPQPPRGEQR
ncbi:MAG: hypothetical protein ACO3ND_04115 [Opitutales bacterium]